MKLLKLTLSILGISLFIACGGNETKEDSKSDEKQLSSSEIMKQEAKEKENAPKEAKTEAKADAEKKVVELIIEGNDRMQFDLKEMKVKAGTTVKLTLKHVGEMTRQQMGHNWVLLKKGTDIMEFGQKSASASDNEYIGKDVADQVIAHTKTIGGGEETTITFEVPAKGTYDFICSFPGHVALMKGKFIVE